MDCHNQANLCYLERGKLIYRFNFRSPAASSLCPGRGKPCGNADRCQLDLPSLLPRFCGSFYRLRPPSEPQQP